MTAKKIRVLIVDDSAVVRRILCESLAKESDIEVVGVAPDPFVARNQILKLNPDVMTLDVEMPRMDGLTFLAKLMHYHPLPVVIISSVGQTSSEAALEALRRGAVEVLAKPSGPYSVGGVGNVLPDVIRSAACAKLRKLDAPGQNRVAQNAANSLTLSSLIAIGASTGGTRAIEDLLVQLPERCPPILIVQHMPPVFSTTFAARLNAVCRQDVKEASDGDLIAPGRVLLAPGDYHMLVRRDGTSYRVGVKQGPRVNYQRPAVDVLFHSVAKSGINNAIGILLTGMGRDGAEGLLQMRQAGATTFAQDESSSVVFGMPKAAIERGAVQRVLPLSRIPEAIFEALGGRKQPSPALAIS